MSLIEFELVIIEEENSRHDHLNYLLGLNLAPLLLFKRD